MNTLLRKSLLTTTLISALMFNGISSAKVLISTNRLTDDVKAKTPASLLFVLSAKTGNIATKNDGYLLTLRNVNPHVLWFSDKPNRKAGFIPLTNFLNNWPKVFTNNSSKAVLVHADMESLIAGKNQPMAIQLSKPTYKQGILTFTLTTLPNIKVITGKLTDIKLFFDNVAPNNFMVVSPIKPS